MRTTRNSQPDIGTLSFSEEKTQNKKKRNSYPWKKNTYIKERKEKRKRKEKNRQKKEQRKEKYMSYSFDSSVTSYCTL